ncbi:recombinase family protein [Cereibacter changlensis]|uniref:recombinase family protein n=1 Tax=Cereibacter changlensis TaxID=402884 RepID=UPI004033C54A
MNTEKPKAYSYVRYSTALQAKGESYRRQTEASAKYAAEHGLELVEDLRLDLGVSAFKGANLHTGALGQFVKECEAGVIPKGSFLIIESLDRMSREDAFDALDPFLRITKAGVTIVTLIDGAIYDRSEPYKLFVAISVMIRANDESRSKSERGLDNWKKKRERAQTSGLKLSAQCPAWLKISEDRKTFIEIPERVAIVRRAFEVYNSGKGANLICKEFSSSGVATFGRGEQWSEQYIDKILKNRNVLGEFQPHKYVDGKRVPDGDVISDYFPAIIDEETFLKAQSNRRERRNHGGGRKGTGQTSIFTHLAVCGVCGGPMRYKDKGNRDKDKPSHVYLMCVNRVHGAGCSSKSWRYGDFEKSFLTFVRAVDLRGLLHGAKSKSESRVLIEAIAASEEKLRHTKERVQSWLIKAENDPENEEVYLSRMRTLNSEAKALTASIDEMKARHSKMNDDADNISDDEMEDLIAAFQNVEDGNRFMLADRLKQLISQIVMYPDGEDKTEKAIAFIEANEAESPDRQRLIDQMRVDAAQFPPKPKFTVFFKSGAVQTVVPDTENPENLVVNVEVGDGGNRMEMPDRDWNS